MGSNQYAETLVRSRIVRLQADAQVAAIDVLASVLQRSFLSPYFSFFFLLLSLSGHPALPSYESCAPYFGVTVLAHLVATSSYVWRNRLWQVADGRDRQSGSWRAVVWGLLKGIGSSPGAVPWEQQAVIITGGSGGLGACLVETLAHQGVTVFVLDVVAYHSENGESALQSPARPSLLMVSPGRHGTLHFL